MKSYLMIVAAAWGAVGVLAAGGGGCDDKSDPTKIEVRQPTEAAGTRVKVEQLGWFADDTSYKGYRRIYLFTDTATGRQYLGVTGVGVDDVGAHKQGKSTVKDER